MSDNWRNVNICCKICHVSLIYLEMKVFKVWIQDKYYIISADAKQIHFRSRWSVELNLKTNLWVS
jgi:hypothetical protein